MKKLFTFLFVVLISPAFAQYVTVKPEVENQTEENVVLTKVVLREKFTILNFVYTEHGNAGGFIIDERGFRQNMSASLISTERESFLRAGNKKYKFIKASGIPLSPKDTTIEVGKRIRFTVFFERLDAGDEVFDYIEGKNSQDGQRHYWNFYGVHITNPVPNSSKKPEKQIEAKPTLANKISIKGKILDAKTNAPISTKILVFDDNSTKKIDSVTSSKSGDYHLELKPETYNFSISASGYEKNEENLDISNVIGKGSFTKNFVLNPTDTVAKETPKIEPKIDSSKEIVEKPVMVEENKFRLDKVYFNIGDASLLPESFPQLEGLLKLLKQNPTMTIEVEGHTDNQGDATLNKRLSLDRAFAVREYLISKGITGNRIKFKGYGDTKPIAPNDTEEGRKKNRRVEFGILTQ